VTKRSVLSLRARISVRSNLDFTLEKRDCFAKRRLAMTRAVLNSHPLKMTRT
jgi:hypothetical protein